MKQNNCQGAEPGICPTTKHETPLRCVALFHIKRTLVFLISWCLMSTAVTGFNMNLPFVVNLPAAFAEDEKKQESADSKDTATGENPCPECPECPDPAKVVLRGLEDKKVAIDKQQKILDKQKKDLAIVEEQIDEKINELKKLQEQIKADMALLDEKKTAREQEREAAYEAKIGRLVKMYAGMKPKNAAQIVDQMNLEVAQEIFLRMREASASQILSFVNSEKAAKISERLAFKKQ